MRWLRVLAASLEETGEQCFISVRTLCGSAVRGRPWRKQVVGKGAVSPGRLRLEHLIGKACFLCVTDLLLRRAFQKRTACMSIACSHSTQCPASLHPGSFLCVRYLSLNE